MNDNESDLILTSVSIEQLHDLLERKNASPLDDDVQSQFFNGVLSYLLTVSSDHWWCNDRERPCTQESLWLFSLPDHHLISQFKEKLSAQLRNCRKCLFFYYAAKPILRKQYEKSFSSDNVESFFSLLARFDRHRVMTTLRRNLYTEDSLQPFTLSDTLICTVYDILHTPRLLQEQDCDRLTCDLFDKMHDHAVFPTFSCEVIEGMASLAFHHHPWINLWARKMLAKYAADGTTIPISTDCMRSIPTWLSVPPPTDANGPPFNIVADAGEKWKAFRSLINLLSTADTVEMLRRSEMFGLTWMQQQVAATSDLAIVELIKTLSLLFRKLDGHGSIWWSQQDLDASAESHYALIKQICDTPGFRQSMLVAHENKADKLVQKDGTAASQDKLIGKIKSRLEWIYLYWKAMPSTSSRDNLTDRVLDILLGYFQVGVWSIICKTLCAEWACDIVGFYAGRDLGSKVNKHGAALMQLASMSTTAFPEPFQDMPERILAILKDVLDAEGKDLREGAFGIAPTAQVWSEFSLWQAVSDTYSQQRAVDMRLTALLLSAYSEFAIADLVPSETATHSSPISTRIAQARNAVRDILGFCTINMSAEERLELIDGQDVFGPFLFLLCSLHAEVRDQSFRFLGYSDGTSEDQAFRQFFFRRPQRVLEKACQLLDAFNNMALPLAIADAFNMVPCITRLLSCLLSALVGDEEGYMIQTIIGGTTFSSEEYANIKGFWDTCWRTVSLIFGSGTRWSEVHKPRKVVDVVTPVFEVAHVMIGARQLFQRLMDSAAPNEMDFASGDGQLQFECVIATVDSLSQWVYVTRTEVLQRLIPLLTSIMKHLHQAHLKISSECYERLMGASTGMNPTRLSSQQKEALFLALSAHEPKNNDIFLDDSSDDEDVQWEMVDATTSLASPNRISTTPDRNVTAMRQLKLGESFFKAATDRPSTTNPSSPPKSKITSYFRTPSSDVPEPPSHAQHEEATPMDISPVADRASTVGTPSAAVKFEPVTSTTEEMHADVQPFNDDIEAYDFDDDFDIADVPDEWFEGTTTASDQQIPKSTTVSSQASKRSKSIAGAVEQHSHDILRRQQQQQQQQQKQIQKDTAMAPAVRGPPTSRFSVQPTKPTAYAVTSTGRKLRPPTMGFSKLRALREEFRAEQKLVAAAKSPSASMSNQQRNSGTADESDSSSSSEGESSSDEDSGLQGLVKDVDKKTKGSKKLAEEERASMKALFEKPVKRSAQMIETPATKYFLEKKIKIQAADRRRQKIRPDVDDFFKIILSWDITVRTEMPPHATSAMYKSIKDRYASFKEYSAEFQALLLLETWMQLVRAREVLEEDSIIDRCVLDSRCHINDFVDVTMNLPVTSANALSVDDLVCVANHFGSDFFSKNPDFLRSDQKPTNWHGHLFLGKIMSIVQKKNISHVTMRCYFSADRIKTLNALSPKTTWRMLKLISMTTAQREYAALVGLEYYDLSDEILHPKPVPKTPVNQQLKEECIVKYGVNEPQAEAIAGALGREKGFTLIQGPPGTGKTKTILGLLVSLLDQSRSRAVNKMNGDGKILVCAPSNAAVDEIAKRLNDGITTSRGVVKPKVVRIGTSESVNASVRDLLLDRMIEKEFAGSLDGREQRSQFASRREKLNEDVRKTQLEIEDVDRAIAECTSAEMTVLREQRRKLIAKRSKLREMLKGVSDDQRDHTRELELSRVRARQKVFASTDIVCATLSGSGHEMLTSLGISFGTVIVDEAAQSVEVSSLIPLKYDCQRCILVGDPNQLPPTVISQMATKYRYDQSLFMRLQKSAPDNVYLLSIQYRMHPAISAFPSKLFYNSMLHDAPDMETISAAPWHSRQYFPPYQFYNVEDGMERTGAGRSLYNAAEAEAAVALVDMLATQMPQLKLAYRIGVITPYKQQLSQLKSRFERRYGPRILDVIDFNTVDGFQGQEKDIIIFSCVRAMSGRGIGFLADIRRMNVGLTRARCSLFVLGHKRSLMGSQYWGDLVKDAMDRRLLIDIRPPYFQHRLISRHAASNLFEKEVKPVVKKRLMPHQTSVRAKRIAIPHEHSDGTDYVGRIAVDRSAPSVPSGGEQDGIRRTERSPPSSVKPRPFQQQLMEVDSIASASVHKAPYPRPRPAAAALSLPAMQPAANQPRLKMTLEEYRASKGLAPLPPRRTDQLHHPRPQPPRAPNSHQHQLQQRNGPNLFIHKPRPSAKDTTQTHERLHARDQAMIEHQAAKEALKELRRSEATQHRHHDSNSNNFKSMDEILDSMKPQS